MKALAGTLVACLLVASSFAVPLDGASRLVEGADLAPTTKIAIRAVDNSSTNATITAESCSLDQSIAPGNLTLCGNATLFNVWRSKARVIAPEGWMNDPMVRLTSHKPKLRLEELILPNSGYVAKGRRIASRRMAMSSPTYTKDDGESWIKLPLNVHGNPVIYEWPLQNLSNSNTASHSWGSTYAFINFPYNGSRQISVGWTYEADSTLALATQFGYQGAFTTMRDIFLKYTRNIDPSPSVNSDLFAAGSWGTANETDGSVTVTTLGQRIIPESLNAWKAAASVSTPTAQALDHFSDAYIPFEQQPTGRYYVIKGQFNFERNATGSVGFRVLASDQEYTDILYVLTHPSQVNLLIDTETEFANLKLWRTIGSTITTLNLTIVVDNSVIEVHANDEATITTRVYPWLHNSTGAGLLTVDVLGPAVSVSELELWDGLVNAWPSRAENSSTGLLWDGPYANIQGLWAGN
ncbi:hypothetical protein P7C70_g428, partial [Phenoliferia sp. Uapishka_3]